MAHDKNVEGEGSRTTPSTTQLPGLHNIPEDSTTLNNATPSDSKPPRPLTARPPRALLQRGKRVDHPGTNNNTKALDPRRTDDRYPSTTPSPTLSSGSRPSSRTSLESEILVPESPSSNNSVFSTPSPTQNIPVAPPPSPTGSPTKELSSVTTTAPASQKAV